MSRLDELRDELYRKKSGELPVPPRESPLPPPAHDLPKRSWPDTIKPVPSLLAKAQGAKVRQRVRSFKTVLAVGVALLIGFALFIGYTIFFAPRSVDFEILGPSQLTAGEPTVITVRIVNRGSVVLRDGVVSIEFPEGTLAGDGGDGAEPLRQRLAIDDIPAQGEFKREIQARFLGVMEQEKVVTGVYIYRPENVESKLTRQGEFSARIVRVPVTVSIASPERVSAGQELNLEIAVDSELSVPLPGMSLGVEFPSGFTLSASTPPPSDEANNIWPLGDLASGTSTKIVLRGTLRGEPREVKAFRLRVGRFDPRSKQWLLIAESSGGPEIASPFLLVQTTLGGTRRGSLAPGTRVEGSVFFKNNLSQKIENITIELSFPEKFVKLESIRAERGFYDVTRQALVWKPSSEERLKEFSPGGEGTVAFSFELKSSPPIGKFSDKNFLFPVTTTIDTASPPREFRGVSLQYRDSIEFKIESRLTLAARAAYYDSPEPNTGSLPPKVRLPTSYTVWLQLSSGANDLRDVELKATLGDGVAWQRTLENSLGTVGFNPASQEILWRIREFPAATGILRVPASAAVQIVLTPADNQAGTAPVILRNISVNGRDAFTDTVQADTVEDLTTELRSDPESKPGEWQVVR